MAWRIHSHVVRGELDNREKGKITGTIWLAGRADPVQLNLTGNAWPDLAGCLLTFQNPAPEPGLLDGFASLQEGTCGDMTASRKVKVPTVPIAQWLEHHRGEPFPCKWCNAIYLEWFSHHNGRVVLEAADFDVTLSAPSWRLSPEEEARQHEHNADALAHFMQNLSRALAGASGDSSPDSTPTPNPPTDPDPDPDAETDELVDRALRVAHLKHQVEQLTGGDALIGTSKPLPLDLQEQFWSNVLAFESAPLVKRRELLDRDGIHPPPPETLTNELLTRELWHVISALARHGIFLTHTDHLSDRELYTLLVDRLLEQETELLPSNSGWNCHVAIDEYGTPAEDGLQIYLRFYASEMDRQLWTDDDPDQHLPPHEEPPFNRDHRLPRPS
jgi:hypothetical protein